MKFCWTVDGFLIFVASGYINCMLTVDQDNSLAVDRTTPNIVTITIKLFYKYISDFIFSPERRYTESLFACL